ncbi:MAG: signal peptidase I [Phycisphaerae bacterium]|nr:signal peptidase I [Phycisphaerae bacterium]
MTKTEDGSGTDDNVKPRKGGGKPARQKPRTPKEYAIAFVRWLWPIVAIVVVVFALRSSLVDWNDVPSGSMQPTIVVGDRIFVNKLSYDLKVPFTLTRLARWDHPQRGDIVIWLHPTEGDWMGKTRLVKRVIGLPGDTIELIDVSDNPATPGMSKLVINGQELTYTPATPPESTKGLFEPRPYQYYTEDLLGTKHLVAFVKPGPNGEFRSGKPAYYPDGTPALDQWGNRLFDGIIRSFGPFKVPEGTYFLMGDNRDESRDCRYFDSINYAIPEANILGRASRIVFSLGDNWLPRGNRFFHEMP